MLHTCRLTRGKTHSQRRRCFHDLDQSRGSLEGPLVGRHYRANWLGMCGLHLCETYQWLYPNYRSRVCVRFWRNINPTIELISPRFVIESAESTKFKTVIDQKVTLPIPVVSMFYSNGRETAFRNLSQFLGERRGTSWARWDCCPRLYAFGALNGASRRCWWLTTLTDDLSLSWAGSWSRIR